MLYSNFYFTANLFRYYSLNRLLNLMAVASTYSTTTKSCNIFGNYIPTFYTCYLFYFTYFERFYLSMKHICINNRLKELPDWTNCCVFFHSITLIYVAVIVSYWCYRLELSCSHRPGSYFSRERAMLSQMCGK